MQKTDWYITNRLKWKAGEHGLPGQKEWTLVCTRRVISHNTDSIITKLDILDIKQILPAE